MITKQENKKIITNLRDFCNIYLIDLIHDGFSIEITYNSKYYNIELIIWNKKGRFKWNHIKDSFLPFYEMLQYDYKLDYQIINKEPKHLEFSQNRYFHNDEVNDDINITTTDYIKIYINSKI